MERRQKLIYGLGGFALGVLLTCAAWMGAGASGSGGSWAAEGGLPEASAAPGAGLEEATAPGVESNEIAAPPEMPSNAWDSAVVYIGGNTAQP